MGKEREKLLKVIKELNISLPRGKKYIKNNELRELVLNNLNKKKLKIKSKLDLTATIKTPDIKINKRSKTKQNKYIINARKSLFAKVDRLVAIGDIHGDLNVAIRCLKLAINVK